MSYLLIQSDARHIPLADNSVHMCVTSPPYYGLRDYGTGRWEGGDAACDHQAPPGKSGGQRADRTFTLGEIYRDVCGKCGARRVDRQIGLEASPDCGKHGMIRMRSDLTEAQRAYVVQRLLALGLLDVVSCDTEHRE